MIQKCNFILVFILMIFTIELTAQVEPCPGTCCEESEGFEGYALGTLQTSTPFQSPGYYTLNPPVAVEQDGCEDTQSLQLMTNVSTIAYTAGSGIAGDNPIFIEGKEYCLSFCMRVNSDAGTASITFESEGNVLFTSPNYSFTDGWVTVTAPTFIASADLFDMTITASGSVPEMIVGIDNICFDEKEGEPCMSDFDVQENDCGEYCFINTSCGINTFFVWDVFDGSTIIHTENTTDLCYTFPEVKTYTVRLTMFGDDCDNVIKEIELTPEFNALELICDIGSSELIPADEECIYVHDLSGTTINGGIGSVNIDIYIDNVLQSSGISSVSLGAGMHTIRYEVRDDCSELSCEYMVTVECETSSNSDCPVDILFLLDNSGTISISDFQSMEASVMSEIAAIDGAYSDVKFSVLHYLGVCGNEVIVEHDFKTASNIPSVNRQISPYLGGYGGFDDLNESLGEIINAFNGTPNPSLFFGSLSTPRAGADFHIVLYTDAFNGFSTPPCTNSAMRPYTNSNVLKASPYNANFTIVHFEPIQHAMNNEVSAAIASPGGSYSGIVDSNLGDPQGSGVPRRYIPSSYPVPALDLLNTLQACSNTSNTDCSQVSVLGSSTNQDSCCYSIDINNGLSPQMKKLEARIISPDWMFNTASISIGSGIQFSSGSVPTATTIEITGASGSMPSGTTSDALQYCFAEAVAGATPPQVVQYNWYSSFIDDNGAEIFILECQDTITTECQPVLNEPCMAFEYEDPICNPDNPYEYLVNFTVTNLSSTPATNVSLNGLPPGFKFSMCGSSTGVSSISIPIPSAPLLPNTTSTTMCVKIISSVPIVNPQNVCFNAGIFSFMGDCCHIPQEVCVELESCCDICDINTNAVPNDVEDQCCYNLNFDLDCDYQLFRKVKLTMLTSGVQFGFHSLGGGATPDWRMCGSSPSMLCLEYVLGDIPAGNYTDLLNYCLDDIDNPAEVPQRILIEYIGINGLNQDTILCQDTLVHECEIPIDNQCLEVSMQDLECVQDSSKYKYTFKITNTSTIPFNATDLDVFIVSPADLTMVPSGGTFPLPSSFGSGAMTTITTDITSTSTFPNPASQVVFGYRLRFMAGDTCCYESILDTIDMPDCFPTDCLAVANVESQVNRCDSIDCCEEPLCQQWIIDLIADLDVLCVPPSGINFLQGEYDGECVFITNQTYIDATQTTIYNCSGDTLQSCFHGPTSPTNCDPDAGIDWNTDIINQSLLWHCGDPVPALSSNCTYTHDIDYTLDVTNLGSCDANQVELTPISPTAVVVNPNPIVINIPANTTVPLTTNIQGYLDGYSHIDFKITLRGLCDDDQEWMCMDTISMPVPECPTDDCCQDEDAFLNNIAQGFQLTDLGNCTFEVCANQFDTCHWFWTVGPDWGDGSIVLPTLTQSDPPNNCWTYTYTTPGTYNITINVQEGAPGAACWDGQLQTTVEVDCCTGEPCDVVSFDVSKDDLNPDQCCYDVSIDNNYCDDYFVGVLIETTAPTTVSQIQAKAGWSIRQLTSYRAEVRPSTKGNISLGVQDVLNICANDDDAVLNFTLSWIYDDGSGEQYICPEEYEEACDGDDSSCIDVIDLSIDCDELCFKVVNTTSPGFTIESIHLDNLLPSGVVLTPTMTSIPPLAPGDTSGVICVDYDNVPTGDDICFGVVGHNVDITTGDFPTWCCTDTASYCIEVPECPTDDCCQDEDEFLNNVAQGFQLTDLGNCTFEVCANQFDTCHWFWTVGPDWGDGSIVLPTLTQSDPPNNCWTYTYTTPGTYNITINVQEGEPDMACWDGQLQTTVEVDCCTGEPCEAVSFDVSKDDLNPDQCCYDVSIDNDYCDDYFVGILIETTAPTTVSQIQAKAGWSIRQLTSYRAEVRPSTSGNISLGEQDVLNICANDDDAVLNFTLSWIYDGGSGEEYICPEEYEEACDGDDSSCIDVIDLSIDCDELCFKVVNTTSPGFTIESIHLDNLLPSGVVLTPTMISIPPLAPGDTSGVICVDYDNVPSGEDICFGVVGHNVDITTGDFPTWCCTDTASYCIEVPHCSTDCTAIDDVEINCVDRAGNYTISFDLYNNTHLFGSGYDFHSYAITNWTSSSTAIINPTADNLMPILPAGQVKTGLVHTISNATPGEQICFTITGHDDKVDSTFTNCCTSDTTYCFIIPSNDDCPCCADYNIDDLELDLDTALNTLERDGCEWCIEGAFPECVAWKVEWDENSEDLFFTDATVCHTYEPFVDVNLCITGYILDPEGERCDSLTICESFNTEDCDGPGFAPCDPSTWKIPNGLTPNGDALNEVLDVKDAHDCKVDLKVYNRWGQLVYTADDYLMNWNGKSNNGEDLPDGTYYMIISSDFDRDGKLDRSVTRYIDIRRE